MYSRFIAAIILVTVFVSVGFSATDFDGDGLQTVTELRDNTNPIQLDTDGDGLSDGKELTFGTDPHQSDSDGDTLTDATELGSHGTNPTHPDSDADGLSDGEEIHTHRTNPVQNDTDSDGLSDAAEIHTHESDPTVADTDSDGLSDAAEIRTHESDPTVADTDSDGLSDAAEIHTHESDPRDADTDADGLMDGTEVAHDTELFTTDTDGDGLADGQEVHEFETSPVQSDTDRDTLADATEIEHGTNPVDPDTDDDTVADSTERSYGTDPLTAQECAEYSKQTDSDGDGLSDHQECLYGLETTNEDTDGDLLGDGEEIAGRAVDGTSLSDSNPARKDLYLSFGVEPGVDVSETVKLLENSPVINHNGDTGIDVHYTVTNLGTVDYTGRSSFDRLKYEHERSLIETTSPYRAVVVSDIGPKTEHVSGYADTPGDFAAGDNVATVLAHEVYHLILGEIESSNCSNKIHVCDENGIMNGYLSDYTMSNKTQAALESGFES